MKRLWLWVCLSSCLAAKPVAYQAEEKSEVIAPGGNIGMISTVFVQHPRVAKNIQAGRWSQTVLFHLGRPKAVMLMHPTRQYMEQPLQSVDDGTLTLLNPVNKPLATEKIGNELCHKYQSGKYFYWVSQATGVQMRREEWNGKKLMRRFEYSQIKLGPQSPNRFRIPKDYKPIADR